MHGALVLRDEAPPQRPLLGSLWPCAQLMRCSPRLTHFFRFHQCLLVSPAHPVSCLLAVRTPQQPMCPPSQPQAHARTVTRKDHLSLLRRSSIATNQYTRNPELSSLPFQPVQLLGGQRSVESAMENIRMARSGLSDDAGGMSGMSPIFTALRHNYSRSQSRVTLDAQQSSSLQASFIEQQKPQDHVQMEPETSVSL